MVFEGAFEKIFSIIKEEGGSDGGVVVQVICNFKLCIVNLPCQCILMILKASMVSLLRTVLNC